MGESGAGSVAAQEGLTSRMRPGEGNRRPWVSPRGPVLEFPVVFDLTKRDATGATEWSVEATIDLSASGEPAVVAIRLASQAGLDLEVLQREFRWATPLEAVTRLAPAMILAGRDPYAEEFPHTGFPQVTRGIVQGRRLSDEFLEDIAREYVIAGRGYPPIIAERHSVSQRTVVGWIEKARARGILTPTRPGLAGGRVVPVSSLRARNQFDQEPK